MNWHSGGRAQARTADCQMEMAKATVAMARSGHGGEGGATVRAQYGSPESHGDSSAPSPSSSLSQCLLT